MKIFLVSNNSLVEGLNYNVDDDLDLIRYIRPLSIKGEEKARKVCDIIGLLKINKIYSSFYTSSIETAKYLAKKLELEINLNKEFNDCKVGHLGSKNMKMVKGMQDHDFNYHLTGGESLHDVGKRVKEEINKILLDGEDVIIFTHRRTILGFLLNYASVGYNLDDNLILEFKGKQIYDDSEKDLDIYELEFKNEELVKINVN